MISKDFGFDGGTLACGAGCSFDVSGCYLLPGVPSLQLSFSQVKRFDFSWAAVADAEYYQLLESPAPGEPFVQRGEDIVRASCVGCGICSAVCPRGVLKLENAPR